MRICGHVMVEIVCLIIKRMPFEEPKKPVLRINSNKPITVRAPNVALKIKYKHKNERFHACVDFFNHHLVVFIVFLL